ncbi:Wd Repeat-Containing Protein 88 [Manis pentadactyla]|nr:Wd Repeat-Containing Protein 88 [Manis pentadactyla]
MKALGRCVPAAPRKHSWEPREAPIVRPPKASVKELNMSGRQLKDLGTSSAKTIRDLDVSKLPSFFLFLFMP